MSLSIGFPHAHQRNGEQQQEIREARRLLKERIRNDWDYPPLPAFQLPVRGIRHDGDDEAEKRVAGFKLHAATNHDRDALVNGGLADLGFEPVEWRERDYSSEETEDDESAAPGSSDAGDKSNFRFEGPDSVAAQISDRKQARKRKRQERLDEEVNWNEGLAHWLARRDAWCGAHTSMEVQVLESAREEQTHSTSASASSTPRSSTSTASSVPEPSSPPASTPSTSPELEPLAVHPIPATPAAPPSDLLIPLAPKMLANHPIRRRITPEIYPEIYTKIIVQSRTPSVPINLLVLTRALVQGWKTDGEWPPKQGPVEKSIGRKRGTHESPLKHGVKAVGRVLRITGGESSSVKDKG